MFFRMVYKSGPTFLQFCHKARVWQTDRRTDRQTDRRTDRQTEFSSLYRVCITCSAVKSISTDRKLTTRFPTSLRWTSYVAPLQSVFCVKSHFAWRKSATEFLCVKTVSDKVVRHSLPYLSVRNDWWGTSPSTWKFGIYWPTPCKTLFLLYFRL